MSRRCLAAVSCGALILVCLLVGLSVMTAPATESKEAAQKEAPGKDVFGQTRVWTVHLTIPATEYKAMQPPGGGFGFGGGPGGPPQPRARKDMRESERNLIGTELPWVQGEITADGKTYKKVGLRYAGDVTYFASAQGLKRPLKVEFKRFGGQQFHGLTSLQLHSMPLDPAKAREALAYSVFRAAGVPAPRTAFAEVTLTVPGKYDKEYLGLYTLVENVDRRFLADRFP